MRDTSKQKSNEKMFLNILTENVNCIHASPVGFDPDLLDDVADDTTA